MLIRPARRGRNCSSSIARPVSHAHLRLARWPHDSVAEAIRRAIEHAVKAPPPRALQEPRSARCFWYPFWYFVPGGFLWVQLSHARQYLPFPLRVDANRYAAAAPRTPLEKRRRTLLAYLGLVVAGAAILNGAVWKLHNEKVSQELFRHLEARTARATTTKL